MSAKYSGAVWELKIDPIAKYVLLALADNAVQDGTCYPKLKTLIEKTSLSRRTVIHKIKELCHLGYLIKTNQFRTNGSKTVSLYKLINLFKVEIPDDLESYPGAPDAPTQVQLLHLTNVHQEGGAGAGDAPGGAPRAPHITKTNNSKQKTKSLKALANCVDQNENGQNLFEQFWQAYPRKTKKKRTEQIFWKLKPDKPIVDKLLLAIEAQLNERKLLELNGRLFPEWPYPDTWLNQERWNDEILTEDQIKKQKPQAKKTPGQIWLERERLREQQEQEGKINHASL